VYDSCENTAVNIQVFISIGRKTFGEHMDETPSSVLPVE
jgi:hypothetical protein